MMSCNEIILVLFTIVPEPNFFFFFLVFIFETQWLLLIGSIVCSMYKIASLHCSCCLRGHIFYGSLCWWQCKECVCVCVCERIFYEKSFPLVVIVCANSLHLRITKLKRNKVQMKCFSSAVKSDHCVMCMLRNAR